MLRTDAELFGDFCERHFFVVAKKVVINCAVMQVIKAL